MALELPDWLTDAFNLIGLPWPGIDEDQLRDWARSVRQFADGLCDTSSQTSLTMQDLADSSQSSVLTAAARQYEDHHRLLTELHGPMDDFAQALDFAADAVVAQKWIVIGAATALAAEFTATQIGAIFSLGADEAAVPAEVISTRTIVKFALKDLEAVVIGRLINLGATELSHHVNHSIVTLANDAWGVHMETQGLKIAYDKVTSAARQLNGHADDAERLGTQAHSQNTSRSLTDNSGGSGWAEVINALKQGLLTIAEDLFKTLPATIAKVIRDLAGILQRLAARLKGADDAGDTAAAGAAAGGVGSKLDGGGDLAQTGGSSFRRPRSELDFETDWADHAYDKIRQDPQLDAVSETASTYGFSRGDIDQIYNHVFTESHELDDGIRQFDANPRMARAWERLQDGSPHPSDIELLRHELYESDWMRDNGNQNYRMAHQATIDAGHTWDEDGPERDGIPYR